MKDFKIVRLVMRRHKGLSYEQKMKGRRKFLLKACASLQGNATLIQTFGGVSRGIVEMPYVRGPQSTVIDFKSTSMIAEELAFKEVLTKSVKQALKKCCRYFTLGVDLFDPGNSTRVEFVGVYDAQRCKFIRWTGKSYPTARQARTLLYCLDLESHFIQLSGHSVLVLGCHDLNMFSPRSWAQMGKQTYKGRTINKMLSLVRQHKPTIVLQHPHQTDSPRIWSLGWVGVCRLLPDCTYSSGIYFAGKGTHPPRCMLSDVLKYTAQGDITDCIQPLR